MSNPSRANWLVPAGLIAIGFIPVAAGSFRLVQLAGGTNILPDAERFFAMPVPVALHIISVSVYCILGAFQFSASIRPDNPHWHRTSGQLLVPFGLLAATTGLWLSHFFPPGKFDGELLYAIRLLAGSAMISFIILGLYNILRRDFTRHRAWMMRGYALGLGAGTQALTGIPWVLIFGAPGELSRALLMGAGWSINLAAAEWIIRRPLLR